MPTALCRRHRRDVVVASTTRPSPKGPLVAPTTVGTLVAALAVAGTLLASGCGGGNGKNNSTKLVSKTFRAFGDSYVRANEPGANFGKNSELRVDGMPAARAYVQFQPFGISGHIERAIFRFFPLSTSNDGFQVRSISRAWSETRIDFDNAPPVGKVINFSGSLSKDHWREIDVTRLVRSTTLTVRLALVALGPTEIAIASRETRSHAPQLVVESGSAG